MERLLRQLAAANVRHNDIWKDDRWADTVFGLELLVDAARKIWLVDFNTGTVRGTSAIHLTCRPLAANGGDGGHFSSLLSIGQRQLRL
jgi:hypothetical protein